MLKQKSTGSNVLGILCGIKLLVTDHGGVVHVDSTLHHHFELPRFKVEDRGGFLGNPGIWSCV